MAIDLWGPTNQGLANLTSTMGTLAQLKRQDQQYADEAPLRTLQMQQAQQGVEQGNLTLANLKGQQNAMIGQYGTQDHTDPIASAYEFQAEEEKMRKAQEAKQKGFEVYLNTIKALDEMKNLDGVTKTEIGKHFLSQNPEYAPFADKLKYVDSKGVKAARQFEEGELKDPATGQPLPAGYYETEGVWTGDAANPVKLTAYKLVPEKKDEHETWGEPYETTVGGKKAMVQKSSRGQVRSVLADNSTTVVMKPGGHGSGHGDAPKPGKPLPAGTLTDLNEASQMLKTLKEAQTAAAGVNTGPIMGRLQSFGQMFGVASGDFTQMKQKIATVNNAMLKLRSGAAVTESEYQRFLQEMPTANDTETVRDAKFGNAINYMENLLDGKISTFAEGGYKVPTGVSERAKPSGGKPQPKQGQTKKGGRFTIIEVK